MKHMLRQREGFALPTILIASVIMLTVLMSAITAVSSITGGLNSQYYNQLAREAAESGLANAETCLRVSNFNPTWTDAAPLKPDTNCNGVVQGGWSKYVVQTANTRTTYTLARPTVGVASSLRIVAVGTVELLRTSDATSPWRTYTMTVTKNSRYSDTPQIAGGAGWKADGHNGYMLTAAGILYGWGDNTGNQLGDPALSLGANVSTPVQIVLPTGVTRAKRVFNSGQGASILCILATHSSLADQIYCRGWGGLGGSTWQRFGLSVGLTALDMSLQGYGADGACVLASDNQAYCAGMNDNGQLGRGTTNDAFVPMNAPTKFRLDLANPGPVSGSAASLTVKKVYTQDRHTCVIASDDQAYCAGDSIYGQLGRGTFTANVGNGNSVPGRAIGPGNVAMTDIALTYHAAREGIFYRGADSKIYMSGHNGEGTAGDGEVADSANNGWWCVNGPPTAGVNCYPYPSPISSPGFGKMISIGERGDERHAMCLLATSPASDSGLWCIGANDYGEIGLSPCGGNTGGYYGAANLSGEVASYLMNPESTYQMNSVAVITTLGNVYTAGDNSYGKLGRGGALTTCNPSFAKVQLPVGVKAVALTNGDEYTMFILGDNGRVYAMGRNNNGQLGDGTLINRSVPVEVKIPRQQTIY